MTDSPQRTDALSPQYEPGSASPDPTAPVPQAPVPHTPVPHTPVPQAEPDPSADRFSAFDEPATAPPSAPPVTPASPVSLSQASPTPLPPDTPAARARRVLLGLLAVGGIVIVLLVLLVVMAAPRSSESGSSSTSAGRQDDDKALPVTPVSVAPSDVPSVPQRPTQVRVEFHGTGRVVDLRLYSSGGRTTQLTGVTLPYAAELSVDPDDAYFSFSADDYGYRGTQAMSCSVTTGGVELSRSVGTQTVDCKVTDGSWSTRR
ncbi:hypothetical protein [Intrasporangium sp. YIM S08009]|uniref:hypothetical protein n=1 Tax=Intrasporangium zincisolvens TaxID=3080018 RepID=UPI002B0573B7|nr:hypothetical protein [Intrasporangium sp. YIM S08009]